MCVLKNMISHYWTWIIRSSTRFRVEHSNHCARPRKTQLFHAGQVRRRHGRFRRPHLRAAAGSREGKNAIRARPAELGKPQTQAGRRPVGEGNPGRGRRGNGEGKFICEFESNLRPFRFCLSVEIRERKTVRRTRKLAVCVWRVEADCGGKGKCVADRSKSGSGIGAVRLDLMGHGFELFNLENVFCFDLNGPVTKCLCPFKSTKAVFAYFHR